VPSAEYPYFHPVIPEYPVSARTTSAQEITADDPVYTTVIAPV